MPGKPVIRHVDRQALGRVLSNILSNAVKYSAGDLRVELEMDGTLTAACEDGCLVITLAFS